LAFVHAAETVCHPLDRAAEVLGHLPLGGRALLVGHPDPARDVDAVVALRELHQRPVALGPNAFEDRPRALEHLGFEREAGRRGERVSAPRVDQPQAVAGAGHQPISGAPAATAPTGSGAPALPPARFRSPIRQNTTPIRTSTAKEPSVTDSKNARETPQLARMSYERPSRPSIRPGQSSVNPVRTTTSSVRITQIHAPNIPPGTR